MTTEQSDKKRVRCDSYEEDGLDLPEVKKLRQDLLENLEDDEICSTSADLDLFMKSFEEEISSAKLLPYLPETEPNLVLEGDVVSVPDNIGYLLEASDDELGLPPSSSSPSQLGDEEVAEEVRVLPEPLDWFDKDVSGFDSFDLGVTEVENINNINGVGNEYVEIDGLFDYSDIGFGTADFVCRPETLPAQ